MVVEIEKTPSEEEVPSGQEEEDDEEEEEEEEESSEEEAAPQEPKEKPKSKFDLLHEYIQQTDNFLNQFDDVVENRNHHRTVYLAHLNPLRETLVALLLRYIQNELPRDDYLYQHIVCCENKSLNNEDFAEHYKEAHAESDKGVSLPETDVIEEYHNVCKGYIAEGKVVNVDLLFKLRRLLRKSNTVLADHAGVKEVVPAPPAPPAAEDGEEKPKPAAEAPAEP